MMMVEEFVSIFLSAAAGPVLSLYIRCGLYSILNHLQFWKLKNKKKVQKLCLFPFKPVFSKMGHEKPEGNKVTTTTLKKRRF